MYYSDKPIASKNDDLLERSSFSELLAKTIVNSKMQETFTIGVFGEWGSGKTSLINLTLDAINDSESEIIVLRFEPWHFTDSTELLNQFLLMLSNEFKSKKDKRCVKIGKALQKYSSVFEAAQLIPIAGGTIASLGKSFINTLGDILQKHKNSILEQKEEVIKLLSQQKYRIVIVIDDIDRLSNEQIRQVFQLVSSVAKFPNTTYILALDKEVVVKALEKIQEGNGEDYLKKIIQMPIQMPPISINKIHNVLFERLDDILESYDDIFFSKEHWQEIFENCINPYIVNLRDINRLCNILQFKLTNIASEVNFADMVAISTIEMSVPPVYDWIKNNKNLLTGQFSLDEYSFYKKSDHEWLKIYTDKLEKIIQPYSQDYQLETQKAIDFLYTLFPAFGNKIGKNNIAFDKTIARKNSLISHNKKFDRYFDLDIDSIGLKHAEIQKAIYQISYDDFTTLLIDLDKKGKSIDFLEEIKALIDETKEDRIILIFRALINNLHKLTSNDYENNIFSLNASLKAKYLLFDLIEKFQEPQRMEIIENSLKEATKNNIGTIADFINIIELSHGRLSVSGNLNNFKKIISIDELEKVEKIFLTVLKEILSKHNLFKITDWQSILHLLNYFDEEYANSYLQEALKYDANILCYLEASITKLYGSEYKYEISSDYKKLLTDEQILSAIENLKVSKRLFDLLPETLNKSIAFYLSKSNKTDFDGRVSQKNIDAMIADLKKSM